MNLGRGEMRAGRSLDALLAAYRLGARVAWRRLAAAGEAAGLEPRTLYLLAESIFAYIDELSGESIEGYAMEQAAAAGRAAAAAPAPRRPAGPGPAGGRRRRSRPPRSRRAGRCRRELAAVVAEGDEPDRLAMRLGTDAIGVARCRRASARWCPIPTRRAAAPSSRPPSRAALGAIGPTVAVAPGGRERGARDGHARPGAGGRDRGRRTGCSTPPTTRSPCCSPPTGGWRATSPPARWRRSTARRRRPASG